MAFSVGPKLKRNMSGYGYDFLFVLSKVILPIVFFRKFIALAFASHVLVGSFCFTQIASAMSVSQIAQDQEVLLMTPAEPMSPAHCKDCLHMQKNQQGPVSMQGNCEGHCFSAHAPDTSTSIASSSLQPPDIIAAAPMVTLVPAQTIGLQLNISPPNTLPMLARMGTVVLRE